MNQYESCTETVADLSRRDHVIMPASRPDARLGASLTILLGISLVSLGAMAADFDGSKSLLCAPVDTVNCAPGGECLRGESERVNLPRFFKVDFTEKQISALKEERSTAILNMTQDENELILQGVQNGRGWSMSISGETGDMTLTVAADRAGHVVFGACTPL